MCSTGINLSQIEPVRTFARLSFESERAIGTPTPPAPLSLTRAHAHAHATPRKEIKTRRHPESAAEARDRLLRLALQNMEAAEEGGSDHKVEGGAGGIEERKRDAQAAELQRLREEGFLKE